LTQGVLFQRQVGQVKAVDGGLLRAAPRRDARLVGESGCGKSTLARLLMGAERPTSGSVHFETATSSPSRAPSCAGCAAGCSWSWQDPYTSLNPRMTWATSSASRSRSTATPRADGTHAYGELLEIVGLEPDHVNRYPHQFSGGQRQRIGIARASRSVPT